MKKLLSYAVNTFSSYDLKKKFLSIYLLVLVLPITLLDTAFFTMTIHSTRKNAHSVQMTRQQNVVQSIVSKAETVEKVAEILSLDANIRSVFGNAYDSEKKRVVAYQMLTEKSVRNLLKLNPDVNAVYLYNQDLIIGEMTESFFTLQKERSQRVFSRLALRHLDQPASWDIASSGLHNFVRPELSPRSAMVYQHAITSHAGCTVASMELVIDERDLFQAMYEHDELPDGFTCIVDKKGKVLFSTANLVGKDIRKLGFSDFVSGKSEDCVADNEVRITTYVDTLGVSVVSVAPLKELYRGMYSSAAVVLLFSAALVSLCGWLFAVFTQSQLRPIPAMMKAMHQIRKGNFSTRVPDSGKDELGALARDFNYMSEKLQGMMEQVYDAGQMEREAELRALESNINPHFLYNSLATITWMARAKDCSEIVETTEALARLYRMVLSDGKSIISFEEEMRIVSSYLKVQKIRFEEKFHTSIDIEEAALSFPIIKNIVQPLVENALEHGIGPMRQKGTIRIQARVVEARLEIIVSDDGVGMTEERRQQVATSKVEAGRRGGYAIKNILERMDVFYAGHYEFTLRSEINKGTMVRLVLPMTPKLMERR